MTLPTDESLETASSFEQAFTPNGNFLDCLSTSLPQYPFYELRPPLSSMSSHDISLNIFIQKPQMIASTLSEIVVSRIKSFLFHTISSFFFRTMSIDNLARIPIKSFIFLKVSRSSFDICYLRFHRMSCADYFYIEKATLISQRHVRAYPSPQKPARIRKLHLPQTLLHFFTFLSLAPAAFAQLDRESGNAMIYGINVSHFSFRELLKIKRNTF